MIEAIKKFMNGYRAVGIRNTEGMEGSGFVATVMKDGRVLGEVADYGDGGPVHINFTSKEEEEALLTFTKGLFPDMKYETDGFFIGELVNYELAVKSLRTKAKKVLMVAEESKLDENGVAQSYSSWKLEPTAENRAKVLAKFPNTVFLNDELSQLEEVKKPKK